jgi:hypothetical protein
MWSSPCGGVGARQKLYGVALERKMEMNALTSMWMACGVLKGDVFQRRVGQVRVAVHYTPRHVHDKT